MKKAATMAAGLTLATVVALGTSTAQAGVVYSIGFDSANGSTINGVVGGTASLYTDDPANQSVQVSTATPDLGNGGYLHVVQSATSLPNRSAVAWLRPTAGNGPSSWVSGTSLNGGFDFFVRSSTAITGTYQGTGDALRALVGTGVVTGGGWGSAEFLNLTSATFTNLTNVKNSQYSSGSNILIGNLSSFQMAANTIYHFGATFSTDGTGLITAKWFGIAGTGAIDTTVANSDASVLGVVTFNAASPSALSGITDANLWFGTYVSENAPKTQDFDTFRLYNGSAPTSFAAQAVPEPAGLALGLAGIGLMLLRRIRRADAV